MNRVVLVGRLTKDPELRATASGIPVCSFTVACDRRYQKPGEERKADFINCIAWQKSAEAIAQYFGKGDRIALEGSLQTRSWDGEDGRRHYVTEVVVDQWEFAQSKGERAEAAAGKSGGGFSGAAAFSDSKPGETLSGDLDGFMPIVDDDLPF